MAQAGKDLNGLENIGSQMGKSLGLATIAIGGFGAAAVAAGAAGAAALTGVVAGVGFMAYKLLEGNKDLIAGFGEVKKTAIDTFKPLAEAALLEPLLATIEPLKGAIKTLEPAIKTVFGSLGTLVKDLTPQIDLIAKALGPALTSGMAAGVPVVKAFAEGLVPVINGLKGMFDELAKGDFATFTKTMMGAIGSLLPEIGRLLAGLAPLGNLILPMIVDAFSGLVTIITTHVVPAMTTIFTYINENRELFTGLAAGIAAAYGAFRIIGLVMAVLAAGPAVLIIAALAALALVFKDDLIPMVRSAIDWFKEMYDKHAPTVAAAIVTIREAVEDMWNKVQPLIKQLVETFKSAFDFIGAAVQTFVDFVMRLWSQWGDDLLSGIRTTWAGITKLLEGVFQIIEGIFDVFTGILTGDWSKAWNGIKDILAGVWKVITGLIQTAWGTIKTTITAALAVIETVIETAWNAIRAFIGSILSAIGGAITGAWNGIKSGTTSAWNAVKTTVTDAWNKIKSSVTDGIGDVVSAVKGMPGKIKSGLGNLGSLLYEAGKDIIEGMLNGIKAMAAKAGQAAGEVANAVKNKVKDVLGISSPSKVFRDIGVDVNRGLVLGLERTQGIRKAAAGLSSAVARGFEAPALSLRTQPITGGPGMGGNTYNITVDVPLGTNPEDVGRELVNAISRYEAVGGTRWRAA